MKYDDFVKWMIRIMLLMAALFYFAWGLLVYLEIMEPFTIEQLCLLMGACCGYIILDYSIEIHKRWNHETEQNP